MRPCTEPIAPPWQTFPLPFRDCAQHAGPPRVRCPFAYVDPALVAVEIFACVWRRFDLKVALEYHPVACRSGVIAKHMRYPVDIVDLRQHRYAIS